MPFDGTPLPEAPALDLPAIYRRTLSNIDRQGWIQGSWTSLGGVCLGEALRRAVASELGLSAIKRADPRVQAAAAGLVGGNENIAMNKLIRLNDHPETSLAQVRSLLIQHS